MAKAGSPDTTSKLIAGSSDERYDVVGKCVRLPPPVMLWLPFSRLIESSNSRFHALRPWGDGPALGAVTIGKFSWKPAWLSQSAVFLDVFFPTSAKNFTGELAYATRASLTKLPPSVERSELLHARRVELWPASTGNPGNRASRLFSVSGKSLNQL